MAEVRPDLLALRPAGGFGAILADPPWRVKMRSEKGMGRSPDGPSPYRLTEGGYYRNGESLNVAERHYATMTIEDIMALPIEALAARDCVLFLWAVDPLLDRAFDVGRAWGFTYKTKGFVWAKERRTTSDRHKLHDDQHHKQFPMGTGYWTRANPEDCLLFTRGAPKRLDAGVRKLMIAPRREHSRKPDETHARVERLVGGPYLELFAREQRPGWSTWGAETNKFPMAAE